MGVFIFKCESLEPLLSVLVCDVCMCYLFALFLSYSDTISLFYSNLVFLYTQDCGHKNDEGRKKKRRLGKVDTSKFHFRAEDDNH